MKHLIGFMLGLCMACSNQDSSRIDEEKNIYNITTVEIDNVAQYGKIADSLFYVELWTLNEMVTRADYGMGDLSFQTDGHHVKSLTFESHYSTDFDVYSVIMANFKHLRKLTFHQLYVDPFNFEHTPLPLEYLDFNGKLDSSYIFPSSLHSIDTVALGANTVHRIVFEKANRSKVRFLSLHTNQISMLDSTILYFENLEVLDIGNNNFTSLPEYLPESLKKVNVTGNPIDTVSLKNMSYPFEVVYKYPPGGRL